MSGPEGETNAATAQRARRAPRGKTAEERLGLPITSATADEVRASSRWWRANMGGTLQRIKTNAYGAENKGKLLWASKTWPAPGSERTIFDDAAFVRRQRAEQWTRENLTATPKAAPEPAPKAAPKTTKVPASKLAQLQTAEQRAKLGTHEQQAAKRALLDYVTTPARMKPLNEADQAYLRAVNAEIDARKANTQRGYGPSPAVRDAVAAKDAAHTALLAASNAFHEKYGVTALEAMAHAGAKRAAARASTRAKRAAKKAQV